MTRSLRAAAIFSLAALEVKQGASGTLISVSITAEAFLFVGGDKLANTVRKQRIPGGRVTLKRHHSLRYLAKTNSNKCDMIVYRQQHVSGPWWPLACPMCQHLRAQNVMTFTTGRAGALATNPISTLTSAHVSTGDASETSASLRESTFSAVQSVPVHPLESAPI